MGIKISHISLGIFYKTAEKMRGQHLKKNQNLNLFSFLKTRHTVYIGDKKDNWFIIDKQSGNVKRKITPKGTDGGERDVDGDANPFRMDDIYLGYTDYTLTMFDAQTNEVKWNLTYSELKQSTIFLLLILILNPWRDTCDKWHTWSFVVRLLYF